jgi:hypothetical protein
LSRSSAWDILSVAIDHCFPIDGTHIWETIHPCSTGYEPLDRRGGSIGDFLKEGIDQPPDCFLEQLLKRVYGNLTNNYNGWE